MTSSTVAASPLIEVEQLRQSYGPVTVLDGVSLDLRAGEVHALLGANGAGKSTLIKTLAGLVNYDSGTITVQGEQVPRHTSGSDLTRRGLAFVHQDLGLVDFMTISENIALANGYQRRFGLIDFAATARSAQDATTALGLEIDPATQVADLDHDAKVMVAVARAFALDARAIVLDEVSSSLPAPQVDKLLAAIRATTATGLGYIYVTHRLDELFGVADRVTVLRDGRVAFTATMSEVSKSRLVDAIVDQPAETARTYAPAARPGSVREPEVPRGHEPLPGSGLRVEQVQVHEHLQPLSFSVGAGEIVALCGLIGCGARDVARVLGGAATPEAGGAELDGARLPLGKPAALRDAGCAYVPGDRQGDGVVATMSIRENLFLSRRGGRGRRGNQIALVPRSERAYADELSESVSLTPAGSVERLLSTLSGGNQQKVVCARAMRNRPKLLVLDDPTAGVDIGSRAQLHALIRDAAAGGAAIVFASTDYEEVATLADRAIVMAGGSVVSELSGSDLTETNLAVASYGGDR